MSSAAPAVDDEGYLLDPATWDEEVARRFAAEEGIELDETYWAVIRFIRGYLGERGVAPDVRHVAAFLADRLGIDRKAAKRRLFEMFPYGYVKQACRIAGMRKPRAWSTG